MSYPVHSAPAAVALANLQGLGDVDLVSANPTTNDVSVLLSQGDGAFSPAASYATGNDPTAIAVGNFTSQGDREVVTADGSGVSVLLGRGDGTLSPAVHYSVPTPVVAVVTGDFTGDGNQDIVAYSGESGGSGTALVTVLPGDGKGNFGTPGTWISTEAGPQSSGNGNVMITITGWGSMTRGPSARRDGWTSR